jgi:hypothetical protein
MSNIKTYAVIDEATNIVINVVLWDGESNWTSPLGSYVIDIAGTEAGIGWKYENQEFIDIREISVEETTI